MSECPFSHVEVHFYFRLRAQLFSGGSMFSLGTIYCMDSSIFHSAGLLVVIFGILWLSSAIIKYVWEWSIVVSVSRDSNMQLQLPPGSMGFPIIGETFSFLWKVYGHLVISRLRSIK